MNRYQVKPPGCPAKCSRKKVTSKSSKSLLKATACHAKGVVTMQQVVAAGDAASVFVFHPLCCTPNYAHLMPALLCCSVPPQSADSWHVGARTITRGLIHWPMQRHSGSRSRENPCASSSWKLDDSSVAAGRKTLEQGCHSLRCLPSKPNQYCDFGGISFA